MRLAGQVDAELAVDIRVDLGEYNRGVCLAAAQERERVECFLRGLALDRAHGERDENFVRVQARVVVAEDVRLERLYRLDNAGIDEQLLLGLIAEELYRVEQRRRARAEQGRSLSGYQSAVGQLDCDRGSARISRSVERGAHAAAVFLGDACLIHQALDFSQLRIAREPSLVIAQGVEIAADYLVQRGVAGRGVIGDAVARHVDAHVRGRFIGALALDFLKYSVEHGEDFNVSVVVDGGLAVSFEVVGVDNVDIVEVGGCRLICEVDGVLQGQVPYGERLELCVSRLDAAQVVVIELGEAGRHLSASGAGRGYNDERALGFDIFILAEALFADDVRDIIRIALDGIVDKDAHAEIFEPVFERKRGGLTLILRDNDAADEKTDRAERVDEAQHVAVIGYAEVAADLVVLDVARVDDNDYLNIRADILEHLQLAVGLEAGQDARGMVVVEELAAELKIELAAELLDAFAYLLGLLLDIKVVIESHFEHYKTSQYIFCA